MLIIIIVIIIIIYNRENFITILDGIRIIKNNWLDGRRTNEFEKLVANLPYGNTSSDGLPLFKDRLRTHEYEGLSFGVDKRSQMGSQ